MQKKIIVLAIAAAMTVPAMAYAEVSISGQANMSYDRVSSGNAAPNDTTVNKLNSNNSRVVLKGSEDLGGGLSAVVFLDSRFGLDTGTIAATTTTASLFGGNAYVGLKSADFGTLLAGRHDTPYKISTRNLDVFFDVVGDNRASNGAGSNGLMSAHDLRLSNVIAYISPAFGGLTVAAATVFGAESAVAATDKKGSAVSLAGMYSMDAIYATLAYQTITVGTNSDMGAATLTTAVGSTLIGDTPIVLSADDKASAFKVGGGFSMDAFTVNAVVERTTVDPVASPDNVTNTNMYLGAKFALSSTDAVRAAYTNRGASKAGATTLANKASQVAIGYVHDMSKATSVYATYVKTSAEGTLADPSVLSFGMKHAF